MTQEKHQALCDLARIKSDRSLQILAIQIAARDKILEKMEEVRAAQLEAHSYAAEDFRYGARLGAVEAYSKSTLAKLTAQLTAQEGRIAELKADAARNFGRVTVLEKLLRQKGN